MAKTWSAILSTKPCVSPSGDAPKREATSSGLRFRGQTPLLLSQEPSEDSTVVWISLRPEGAFQQLDILLADKCLDSWLGGLSHHVHVDFLDVAAEEKSSARPSPERSSRKGSP